MDVLQQAANCFQLKPDFPKPGVLFRNPYGLFAQPRLLTPVLQSLWDAAKSFDPYCRPPEVIACLQTRGYLLGAAMAQMFGVPCVPIMKAGKLSHPALDADVHYRTEYSEDALNADVSATAVFADCKRVLIVDDCLVTGGTAAASIDVVQRLGGIVQSFGVLSVIQLPGAEPALQNFAVAGIKVAYVMRFKPGQTDNVLDAQSLFPNIIATRYTPSTGLYGMPGLVPDTKGVLFFFPQMEDLGLRIIAASGGRLRRGLLSRATFPDGHPNNSFEPRSALESRDFLWLLDLTVTKDIMEQIMFIKAINANSVQSTTILVPYYAPGTMERVEPGPTNTLATAESYLRLLTDGLTGRVNVIPVDIHALPEKFYVNPDKAQVHELSAAQRFVPQVLNTLSSNGTQNTVVVFPDEGAYKRFSTVAFGWPYVVCSKIRDGNRRYVTVTTNASLLEHAKFVLIVDDICHSGGTLVKCAEAVRALAPKLDANGMFAWITHLVCETGNRGALLESFDAIFTTDSVPGVSDAAMEPGSRIMCFTLASLFAELPVVRSLACLPSDKPDSFLPNRRPQKLAIMVAGTNPSKLDAVYLSMCSILDADSWDLFSVSGISSGVPEQPVGSEMIVNGAKNRAKGVLDRAMLHFNSCTPFKITYRAVVAIGIETGLFQGSDHEVIGVSVILSRDPMMGATPKCLNAVFNSANPHYALPIDLVEAALRDQTSAGKLFGDSRGVSADDWYRIVSGGKICRVSQLLASIELNKMVKSLVRNNEREGF